MQTQIKLLQVGLRPVKELNSNALGRLLSKEEEGGILYHFAPNYQGHAASLLEQVSPFSLVLPFATGTLAELPRSLPFPSLDGVATIPSSPLS